MFFTKVKTFLLVIVFGAFVFLNVETGLDLYYLWTKGNVSVQTRELTVASGYLDLRVARLCNDLINRVGHGVKCNMDIEAWSMDLVLPKDPSYANLEDIATVFCQLSELMHLEPKLTVNGLPQSCGGMEI